MRDRGACEGSIRSARGGVEVPRPPLLPGRRFTIRTVFRATEVDKN